MITYKIFTINDITKQIAEEIVDFPYGKKIHTNLTNFGFCHVAENVEFDIVILILTDQVFYEVQYLHQFANNFREVSRLEPTENTKALPNHYKPIITFFPGECLPENRKTKFGIQFWDTSIWQRWIDLDHPNLDNGDWEKMLQAVLYEVRFYFDKELYRKDVSIEYCEFTSRLYKNSFLIKQGTINCHANFVTPFPFLSEGKFEVKPELTQPIKGHVWRILLVDDETNYKFNFLKALLNDYAPRNDGGLFNVIDLNEERTQPPLSSQIKDDRPTLLIKQVFTIDQAKAALDKSGPRYDVILLDYLLAEGANAQRETGKQLLDELKTNYDVYNKSVSDKLWIFLTTSYPTAFVDYLQNDLTSLISARWNIERGASFIQTPNYFLSSFCTFLHQQLLETNIHNLKLCWLDCLRDLATDEKKFSSGWANKSLTRILSNWAEIEALKSQRTTPLENQNPHIQCFADRFFYSQIYAQIKADYDSGLYSYLTHLLFMLSFNDGYDWEKMKTNFEVIKALTLDGSEFDDKQFTEIKKAFKKINDHIGYLKLKYDP